jgi:hypothetical protein
MSLKTGGQKLSKSASIAGCRLGKKLGKHVKEGQIVPKKVKTGW